MKLLLATALCLHSCVSLPVQLEDWKDNVPMIKITLYKKDW